MCHSLLDGNGPRTNLFFHKNVFGTSLACKCGRHDDYLMLTAFLPSLLESRISICGILIFFFRLLFNKRPGAAPSPDNSVLRQSDCSGSIPRSTVCRLSLLQAITLISLPSTQLLQPRDYCPSISPASHPGITSSKYRRLIRLGQHHATGDPRRDRYILTNTTIATHRPTGVPLCLPSRRNSRHTLFSFRNVKANGSGESRAASVCLSCLQPAPLHLCTCTCTIQPTPDSAGIRQSASSGRHKGASQPVSRPRRIDSSSHHRQIR